MSDDQPRVGSAAWLRENDPEKYKRQLEQARAYRESHREQRAAWRAANRDHLREYNAQWKRDNPERSRQLNRESMRRAAARERQNAERRQARAADRIRDPEKYAKHREAERERSRQYRENHPEKVREYQRRSREKNPDRAKETSRAASQAYRDRNADKQRAANREAARARREADPDVNKRQYAKNLEASRARSREKNQLRDRLKELGLPPRHSHRVYADQKRSNARAADEFFNRDRRGNALAIHRSENIYRSDRLAWDERRRTRLRMIAEISPAAAAATRIEGRDSALREVISHRDFLADTQNLRRRVLPQIREEVRMDVVAAQIRGRDFDPRAEFHRLVEAAIVERGPEVLREKLEQLTRTGMLDLNLAGDREAVNRLVKEHYRTALRLTDPKLTQRAPASERSSDQARWWGVDADRSPARTSGEVVTRSAKDTEATTIACDAAKTRNRGRGLER